METWIIANWTTEHGNHHVRECSSYTLVSFELNRRLGDMILRGFNPIEKQRTDNSETWILTRGEEQLFIGIWQASETDSGGEYYVDAATRTGMYDGW